MPKREATSGRIMPSMPPPPPKPIPPLWPVRSSKFSLSGASPSRIGLSPCLAPPMLHHRYGCNRQRGSRQHPAKGDSRPMQLQGKTALVTGSTSGIGLAMARAFAFEGASLMINGFGDPQEIEATRRELENSSGAQVLYDGADLGDADAIEAMVKRCAHELTAPDILVNNAGIQFVSPVEEFPAEKWEAILK